MFESLKRAALACALILTLDVRAGLGDQAQTFTLEGELYANVHGTAPLLDLAQVDIRILDPSKACVLYAERQVIDTAASDGVFSIEVGSVSPSAKRIAGDRGNSMALVFQNISPIPASGSGCAGATYVPSGAGGDGRYLEISVTPQTTGITDRLSPDIFIGSVPSALTAQTLMGISPAGFLRLGTITHLTQADVETIFSDTNYPILTGLLAGGGGSGTSSTTNTLLNADSDGNSSGSVQLAINGSVKAEVKNNGDFVIGSNRLGIGATAPSFDLSFGGEVDRILGLERRTATDTAGKSIHLQSGGATLGATNKTGGDLFLASGASTGTGSSNIYLQTAKASTAGSTDNPATTKVTILGDGSVGIGTQTPRATLEVASGSLVLHTALPNPTAIVDFSKGNLQYTSADCGSFELRHLKDGGTYSFAVQGTNSALCDFTAFSDNGVTALSVRMPPGHTSTVQGTHTMYSLMVMGSFVYVAWIAGY